MGIKFADLDRAPYGPERIEILTERAFGRTRVERDHISVEGEGEFVRLQITLCSFGHPATSIFELGRAGALTMGRALIDAALHDKNSASMALAAELTACFDRAEKRAAAQRELQGEIPPEAAQ